MYTDIKCSIGTPHTPPGKVRACIDENVYLPQCDSQAPQICGAKYIKAQQSIYGLLRNSTSDRFFLSKESDLSK